MAEERKGFLDDTSLSKTPRSPLKTSTAMKENKKRRDFQRKQHAFESDSIFLPGEASFSALHEVTNVQKFLKNPVFHLNASHTSDAANSSLGILQADKFNDLTEGSLDLSINSCKNGNIKKSPKRGSEFSDIENKINAANIKDSVSAADSQSNNQDSSSSSDIEYDGTNIPELNLDFNSFLSTGISGRVSELGKSNCFDAFKLTMANAENDEKSSNNRNNSTHYKTFDMSASQLNEGQSEKSTSRQSIFENFHPQYDSIFKQLMPQKELNGGVKVKSAVPEKIKVCPFLDVSSFEIEPVLLRKSGPALSNRPDGDASHNESSVEFCPEQISARSSSFKSSLKASNSSLCGECSPSVHKSVNFMVAEKDYENLRDEVLTGSVLQNSEMKSLNSSKYSKALTDFKSFSKEESLVSEKNILDEDLPSDLALHCDLRSEPYEFIAEGEKWSSLLGISESEFFSSDVAKEILKKDKEMFEQEHMFEPGNMSKTASLSSWAPTSPNDITPPSWFAEIDGNQEHNSNRHVSIGTLISARTENLGVLSEDSNRERPFFGTPLATPVRGSYNGTSFSSEYSELHVSSTLACEADSSILKGPVFSSENVNEMIRASSLSRLINDLSSSDPVRMASKILEKCKLKSDALENDNKNYMDVREHNAFIAPDLTKNVSIFKNECINSETALIKSPLLSNFDKTSETEIVDKKRGNKNYMNVEEQSTFTTPDSTKNVSIFNNDLINSEMTLIQSPLHSNFDKTSGTEIEVNEDCKTSTPIEVTRCSSLDQGLNFSAETVSEKNDKALKSDTCSTCHLTCEQSGSHLSSRPMSACSSVNSNPSSVQNVVYAQHGCVKYCSSQERCHQNMVQTTNLLQQGSVCPHCCQSSCTQHTFAPNAFPHPFQSVHQTAVSGSSLPLFISGTGILYSGLTGPNQLNFPEKICIGDSQQLNMTIQNSLGNFYHISYLSAYINDSPFPAEMSGVNFNRIIPASSGSTTDIQFTLSPKYEGNIQVEVQIVALTSPVDQAFSVVPGASLKSKIIYEAMHPSVSLLCKEKESVVLGHVIAGSTVVEYITVINKSEVTVPLRISLSSDISDSHIEFGLKELDRKRYPTTAGLKFLSPKVILYCLPATKSKTAESRLDIPIIFVAGNNVADIDYTLTAAVETPLLSETLAFIRISASVGLSKLELKDNVNPLVLKAKAGYSTTQQVTVINQGTLHAVYDLQIESDSDCFTVSPSSLSLQPLESSKISVSFSALSSLPVKGNLQAAAQPHGNVSSVLEILGEVFTAACFMPKFNANANRNPVGCIKESKFSGSLYNHLECNKKHIAWGGVNIGCTVCKSFTIRNASPSDMKLILYIKGNPCFKFMIDSNQKGSTILNLGPNEEKTISVAFMPNEIAASSGIVGIKIVTAASAQKKAFAISLSGYGGTGALTILDLPNKEGHGYCMDIDAADGNHIIRRNLVIHNIGVRAVFVKAIVSFDGCAQEHVDKFVEIHPSGLVLLENEKKNLLVSFNFEDRIDFSNFGVISLIYGDEIMRQLLRKNQRIGMPSSDSIKYENFCPFFEGEDRVSYESSYITSPRDLNLFQNNLKKIAVNLFLSGQNRNESQMAFGALSEIQDSFSNLTVMASPYRRLSSPLVSDGKATPVKESSLDKMCRLSLPKLSLGELLLPSNTFDNVINEMKELQLDSWSVKPEELIVDMDNKDNRILLNNHSKQDMRFKIEYAVEVVSVSPVSGILPANGSIGLRVTIITNSLGKLSEDYQGYIKILCDGSEKDILVKVLKPQKNQKKYKWASCCNF